MKVWEYKFSVSIYRHPQYRAKNPGGERVALYWGFDCIKFLELRLWLASLYARLIMCDICLNDDWVNTTALTCVILLKLCVITTCSEWEKTKHIISRT